jgi:hypothetical protein
MQLIIYILMLQVDFFMNFTHLGSQIMVLVIHKQSQSITVYDCFRWYLISIIVNADSVLYLWCNLFISCLCITILFIHMIYLNLMCPIQCFRYLILNNLLIYVIQLYNLIDVFYISRQYCQSRSLEQNKYMMMIYKQHWDWGGGG